MKEQQRAFNASCQQKGFLERDTWTLKTRQAKDRQQTRFVSMLQRHFGGRKAIRIYLETGKLVDRRFARDPEGLRPVPEPRTRPLKPEAKARKRSRYFQRMAHEMTTGLPAPPSKQQLAEQEKREGAGGVFAPAPQRTAHLRQTMPQRTREQGGHATHEWAQWHLRHVGLALPPTDYELNRSRSAGASRGKGREQGQGKGRQYGSYERQQSREQEQGNPQRPYYTRDPGAERGSWHL